MKEKLLNFENIFREIKRITGGKSQKEIGEALGITGAAVTDAKKRNTIPDSWFDTIENVYNVTKEEILQRVSSRGCSNQKPDVEYEKSSGHRTLDLDREKFNQDMDGLFSIIKRWQEEENGADPLTSMQFIQFFHERIPELGEWIKKQKGGGAKNSSSGNLSVAGGES